eukprot:4364455-Alexandrium_andersonii.AAC.1
MALGGPMRVGGIRHGVPHLPTGRRVAPCYSPVVAPIFASRERGARRGQPLHAGKMHRSIRELLCRSVRAMSQRERACSEVVLG